MSDERFTIKPQDDYWAVVDNYNEDKVCIINGIHTEIEAIWVCDFMNEQQELIEELQVSDEMGWKRAEHFEKKCPKELHNKKMYIKRLEYKVQKFKEENEKLQKENNDYEKQFRIINEKLDEYIKTADTYRIPISSLKYGDELGYFNGVYQYMKELKKDIGGIGYE